MWGNEDTTEELDCAAYTLQNYDSNKCTKALADKCMTIKVFSLCSVIMLLAAGGLVVPHVRKMRVAAAVLFGLIALFMMVASTLVATMLYAGDDYSSSDCSPFQPPPVFYARRVEYGCVCAKILTYLGESLLQFLRR